MELANPVVPTVISVQAQLHVKLVIPQRTSFRVLAPSVAQRWLAAATAPTVQCAQNAMRTTTFTKDCAMTATSTTRIARPA